MTLTDAEKAAIAAAKKRGELCPLCHGTERMLVNNAARGSPRSRDDVTTVKLKPEPCYCTTLAAADAGRG